MPSAQTILDGLAAIANQWRPLAVFSSRRFLQSPPSRPHPAVARTLTEIRRPVARRLQNT
jgi:hypothetical protein